MAPTLFRLVIFEQSLLRCDGLIICATGYIAEFYRGVVEAHVSCVVVEFVDLRQSNVRK